MAVHLLGNVYQIGGEMLTDPLDSASYLIADDQDEHILIDCGSESGFPKLVHQLGGLGIAETEVTAVYGTHCHYDHVSAAVKLPNAPLMIHAADQKAVENGDKDLTASFLYGRNFPPNSNVEIVEDGYETRIGETVLRAMHTPGHTPGSMCYKLTTPDTAILIAGDTLWGGYSERIMSDLDAWEISLDKLLSENFDYVSFGHGVTHLVPRAMAHLALAKSIFRTKIVVSHQGLYLNPWAASSVSSSASR